MEPDRCGVRIPDTGYNFLSQPPCARSSTATVSFIGNLCSCNCKASGARIAPQRICGFSTNYGPCLRTNPNSCVINREQPFSVLPRRKTGSHRSSPVEQATETGATQPGISGPIWEVSHGSNRPVLGLAEFNARSSAPSTAIWMMGNIAQDFLRRLGATKKPPACCASRRLRLATWSRQKFTDICVINVRGLVFPEVHLSRHVQMLKAYGDGRVDRVQTTQDQLGKTQDNVSTSPASTIPRSRVKSVAPATLAVATRMRSAGS